MRALLTAVAAAVLLTGVSAQTDLDALMGEVLLRRDENWKKLQQYVLEEREHLELRASSQRPVWGEHREYSWYIRNGLFVRSPVKINGAMVSESDRQKYEADFLKRQERREGRGDASGQDSDDTSTDGILRQMRQPQFISSAYFLRFKFEQGKYAFVERETVGERETLRVEYYPERLFTGTDRRRGRGDPEKNRAYDTEFRRLMNKVALVTLWVDPAAHQIVKYTFNNIALDFLPAQWLVHVDEVKASMIMGQPFPDVWLPASVDIDAAMSLVAGQFYVHYGHEYHDYRQADVTTKIKIP